MNASNILSAAATFLIVAYACRAAANLQTWSLLIKTGNLQAHPILKAQTYSWAKATLPNLPTDTAKWPPQILRRFTTEVLIPHAAVYFLANIFSTSATALLIARILSAVFGLEQNVASSIGLAALVIFTTLTFTVRDTALIATATLTMSFMGISWQQPPSGTPQ